jgi:hypothetical protein
MSRRDARTARSGRYLLVLLALLLFNSVFLAVANRMPGPPRLVIVAFFYMGNVALHLLLGLIALLLIFRLGMAWWRAIRATPGAGSAFGALSAVGLVVCLFTGLALLVFGNLRPQHNILAAHGLGALVAALCAALWMGRGVVGSWGHWEKSNHPITQSPNHPITHYRPAILLILLAVVPGFTLMWFASRQVEAEARIVNGDIAPVSMAGEGDGPKGKFWPGSVQSVDNRFFPPEYFTDNKSCGAKGCHPDIYAQWESSVHHRGSFNNQWYRKSIEYMQEVVGTQPSKWCGGCHDMAILLTEMPGTGKSRMDFPIKDQIYPPEKHPEAHAGIGCAACHSTVHVKSTMGNNDYLADYPPMHEFVISKNPLMQAATTFLTRLAPDPHRKTFLKPFHTQDTAKFCSACHKVHLDAPVNNFRWFRGFNEYDAWQASGVSGYGARSFYYPNDNGKPAFKSCENCHMPLVASKDAGNISGAVHSHRFLAANTALPYVYHDQEQLRLTQNFLKAGQLSIDIFALRREKADAGTRGRGDTGNNPKSKIQNPKSDAPQTANLFGEAATTGQAEPLMRAAAQPVNETVTAPLDRGAVAVRRGEDALIDVVVRTRKVGHAFPGGTFDAFDVWVELQAKDEHGKVLFWSGCLQWPDGPVEKGAHQYRALLVDGHGNLINKRNAWSARTAVYVRAIPPGAADTIHYRLHIPKDCGRKITLTAKLNYRKFSWWNTQFAFGGRPEMPGDPNYSKNGFIQGTALGKGKTGGAVTTDWDDRPMKFDASLKVDAAKDTSQIPKLPITVLCSSAATLDVVDGDPMQATAPRGCDDKKDRERWNDYGIGLMLQGDFQRATKAFRKVTEISPGWPEGYVNIGRVRLLEGDLKEARAMLEKALAMYDSPKPGVPPLMVPYLKARTQFFYGLALKSLSRYDDALKVWTQAARIFPDDRELRDQMGRLYFQAARFDDAIREFQHVLTIDPEDLMANFNLSLCYRGKGPEFAAQEERHRALYRRFKADETKTHIAGPYVRQNPWDNVESQPIHEHVSAPLPRRAAPGVARLSATRG